MPLGMLAAGAFFGFVIFSAFAFGHDTRAEVEQDFLKLPEPQRSEAWWMYDFGTVGEKAEYAEELRFAGYDGAARWFS